MKKYLLSFLLIISSLSVIGQTIIKGKLKDAETSDVLIGANVSIKGTTEGGMTDIVGDFSFSTSKQGNAILVISYVGYETTEKSVTISGSTLNLGNININPSAIGLSEVEILADIAIDRKTPVAVSTIKPEILETKMGEQEFPEILKSTPGIYATKGGGGFGDARVNIRGFNSVNVGVLINGMPVNDMENGRVYWSNWANLTDVARTVQVQRGLGASKLAIPSTGGTINVITKTTDAKKGGSLSVGLGSFGRQKQAIKLSTGLMENGVAITFAGTHKKGDGFVKGTEYEGWSYFLSIAKKFNERHELAFTAFGAPQEHGQRISSLSADGKEAERFGIDHNKDIGYYKGNDFSSRVNFYHKPVFILNHYWTISERTDLSTSTYASFGTGGGSGFYGRGSTIRDADGLINFDQIAANNVENPINNSSNSRILRNSVNNHQWYGALSSLTTEIGSNLTLNAGIDLRYYVGEHYREVRDLLGEEYFVEKDGAGTEFVALKDDVIDYNYDGNVLWEGLFTQLEYSQDKLSAFASLALSNTTYWRTDYWNFKKETGDDGKESDNAHFIGYSAKGGANYNLSDEHNVFFNAGYFSKAPFFNTVFLDSRYEDVVNGDKPNEINKEAVNEKVISFEVGYGYRGDKLTANINLYYTKWMDRGFTKAIPDNQAGETLYANLTGVDALHQGIELDFIYELTPSLTLNGMVSLGDWTWLNDLTNITVPKSDGSLVEFGSFYMKDLKVGDAAQKTYAFGLNYTVFDGLKIGTDINFYTDNYFDFDPTKLGIQDKSEQTPENIEKIRKDALTEIVNYGLWDANISYKFNIGNQKATWYANIHNILDTEYISDGGQYGVYYGWGRNWSMGLRFNF